MRSRNKSHSISIIKVNFYIKIYLSNLRFFVNRLNLFNDEIELTKFESSDKYMEDFFLLKKTGEKLFLNQNKI
jgi:hypothetical protein